MDINNLTITSLQDGLKQKTFSATEIAEAALEKIEQKEKDIHAFLTISKDLALSQAREVDVKISKGEDLSPLSGVPVSIKDAILVEGERCTAGSRILENYIAPYDAAVVKKIKEAGAVIIGKTNMDEFGMGASTENSSFAPTKNPHDLARVPGGSSGGSAASVACGEAMLSLGEDTGGSIRQPASFCGVVGLKPTYGAVSRYGLIALASSFDQIGPFAKTVEDAETLFRIIMGKDPCDATSVDWQYNPSTISLKNLTIGIAKEYFGKGLDPGVERIVHNTIQKFEDAGATIKEVDLPHTQYALAAYYIINTSEASANLARYDGIRYGVFKETENILSTYLTSRGEGLGTEVKRRIMLGTYALSAGYYDAYYLKAQKIRTLLKQDFNAVFQHVDVIMGPVSPTPAFTLGEKTDNPLAMYLSDVYTVPMNLVGLPAISLPIGRVDSPSAGEAGLPVGLQVIAPAFQEDLLFSVGQTLENMQ